MKQEHLDTITEAAQCVGKASYYINECNDLLSQVVAELDLNKCSFDELREYIRVMPDSKVRSNLIEKLLSRI
jgi:hypothetical protein